MKVKMTRQQWQQLDHIKIIYTPLQTASQASISSLNFLDARCSSRCETNSVKALKAIYGRPMEQGRLLYFCPVVSFFFFFSSPNLIRRRLDVCHTSTHGVALVQIQNAGLKCTARGSLQMQDAKNRHLGTIAQLCRAISLQLRHISTIGKKTC